MGIVSNDNAEHYVWGVGCDGWHFLKTPGLSVIKERMPAGREEIRHYHDRAHQFFYILQGRAALEVDGEVYNIEAHQGCSVPPKVSHQLKNLESEELIFVLVSAPPSHGDRVEVRAASDLPK
jgi:mannose-6-phosphate isomerase-like protein (cupin superfamily)